MSPKRAAEILDVSEATIWRWTKSNPSFPKPVKLSPGCTRFSLESIQHFVQEASGARP
ncbi:MAG: helix-turn-helix domain-containing protein [Hyphomonadaceae bacterium]